jgi:predicted alpha/beta superfamily hydrolase
MPLRFLCARLARDAWIATLALMAVQIQIALADEQVTVELHITVPDKTPAGAPIYISGDRPELGDWDGKGLLALRQADGVYHAKLLLPRGTVVEYKITRGSWQTVEKSGGGAEIENRTLLADADKIVSITVAAFADAQSAATRPATRSTITGDVHYYNAFHSDILHNDRTVIVWLPPGYRDDSSRHYPVLYLHDGQNCFDASTSFAGEWQADETADALIRAGRIQPLIMVAVANAGAARMREYTPTPRSSDGKTALRGGDGEKYAQFLITELKPVIDRTYRTLPGRDHTAVAGSSLGGLNSLYLGLKHGEVFGLIGAVSPSLWWDNRFIIREIEADPSKLKGERIWLDMGTAESREWDSAESSIANARALARILNQAFPDGRTFKYLEVPGAEHNEQAWEARFGQVLEFLFGN